MIIVTLIAGALLWDNFLGFYEGTLLFILFAAFILTMLNISRKEKNKGDAFIEEQESEIPEGVSNQVPSPAKEAVQGAVDRPNQCGCQIERHLVQPSGQWPEARRNRSRSQGSGRHCQLE